MAHWTEELFKENPRLFLNVLKELNSHASIEVKGILKLLDDQGFKLERILDLNCGIGRHSIELGKRGIEVLGTDISPTYIKIAEERAQKRRVGENVHFKVADMRQIASTLSSEQPFDGIMCLWTSFGFYDDETNDDILRQCLKLVVPGGFFALDIVNRDWLVRNFSEKSFERTKGCLVLEERKFDPQNSRHQNKWTFMRQIDDKTFVLDKSFQLDLRVWSLHELVLLFERTGWKFECAYPGASPVHSLREVRFSSQNDDLLDAGRLLIISSRPDTRNC
jgi:2-polyprenyl-3-methyl-5-hydroxy-6-metoxy-1,4-benzoquinol methylase